MWPDVEIALVAGVRENVPVERVGTLIPGNVETLTGFVRVTRGPGSDDLITDSPMIDVETFAPKYGDAKRLADRVRAYLLSLSGTRVGEVLFDRVRTSNAPTAVYYADDVHRFVASYRVEFRK